MTGRNYITPNPGPGTAGPAFNLLATDGTYADGAVPRVLVVEDDRGVTRMLRFALREAGFEVTQAGTGGEALPVLEKGLVDAVVLDLGLPDGLGGEVLEWLRQHGEPQPGGPAWVVITALDRQEATRQYGYIGGRFLAKPFDPWELIRMLNAFLLVDKNRPSGKSE